MKKVLLIDDDQENLTLISQMLSPHFQTINATSGRDGIQTAIKEMPDCIVLDVNMPEMDGFDVCQRLREQLATRHIPIIMLTALTEVDSRVKGLDQGADDYLGKPFQTKELIARINARLRRREIDSQKQDIIEMGNLRLDPKSFEVMVGGTPVHLTRIEFDLLRYFLEHPNQAIEREKLLGDLWPDVVVSNRTVDTHMANLRKKIKGFSHPLETIYGAGYILKKA